MSILTNRRRFLIGSTGVTASLTAPHLSNATNVTSSLDPNSERFSDYFAFLAHEHRRVWFEMQYAKRCLTYDKKMARHIVTEEDAAGCWPSQWRPNEPKRHITHPKGTAMHRAKIILEAVDI